MTWSLDRPSDAFGQSVSWVSTLLVSIARSRFLVTGFGRRCQGVKMDASSKEARHMACLHYRLEWRHRWRGEDGVNREIVRATEAKHPAALQTLADGCAFGTTRNASCNKRSSAGGEPMRFQATQKVGQRPQDVMSER